MKKTAKATKAKSPAKKTTKAATSKSTANPASKRGASAKKTDKSAKKPRDFVAGATDFIEALPLEKLVDGIRKMMLKKNANIDSEEVQKFEEKVNEIWNFTPTVCVFGQTGAGKSSLCNSLFGENKFDVSAYKACTLIHQEGHAKVHGDKKIRIIDMPGVGESDGKDSQYQSIYEEVLKDADLALWILKADSRAYASDIKVWDNLSDVIKSNKIPALFVLAQSDKMDPVREWDVENNHPGQVQTGNLLLKKKEVEKLFGIQSLKIIPVSSSTGYNLKKLVLEMILSLPKEKKVAFFNAATPEVRTNEASKDAEKGFFDEVFNWCKEAANTVWEFVKENKREILSWLRTIGEVVVEQKKRSGSGRRR
jgi:small GTP-binding protein